MSQFIYGFLAALVVPIIALFAAGYIGVIPQIKPLVVQSGSMSPAIKTGDVVFIQKSPSYRKDEVIAFKPENSNNLVTHRIVSAEPVHLQGEVLGALNAKHLEGGPTNLTFQTKGDANEEADPWQVSKDKVAGKVVLYIPGLGFGVDFVKHPQGFVLLVIIPAAIIIWEELKVLLGEIAKMFSSIFSRTRSKKRFNTVISASTPVIPAYAGIQLNSQGWILDHGSTSLTTRVENDKSGGSPKLMILVPLVGFFFLVVAVSGAYFLDSDKSLGNILGAASSFASPSPSPTTPPIAQTLVVNELLWNSSCGNNDSQRAANYWIELYNGSASTVDLKDWRFRDGSNNIIQISNAVKLLPSGQYMIITKDGSVFQNCYNLQGNPVTANLGGSADFLPTTTGGVIRLEQPDGLGGFIIVDRVQYGPSQNAGVLNALADQSIARVPNGVDSALGDTFSASDFIVDSTPTPGTSN